MTGKVVAAGIGREVGKIEVVMEVDQTFDSETQCAKEGEKAEANEDPLCPAETLHITNLKGTRKERKKWTRSWERVKSLIIKQRRCYRIVHVHQLTTHSHPKEIKKEQKRSGRYRKSFALCESRPLFSSYCTD